MSNTGLCLVNKGETTMKILDMAKDLIDIHDDIVRRTQYYGKDFDIYDFDQTWGSTALGFGGIGGSAMTTARTYVLVPDDQEIAHVYFAGRYAYTCKINDAFREDLRNRRMADVIASGKYGRVENE